MTLLSEAMQMSNSIHDAESFLEYGCWCASNPSSNGYDLTKGKSAPVDNIDRYVNRSESDHQTDFWTKMVQLTCSKEKMTVYFKIVSVNSSMSHVFGARRLRRRMRFLSILQLHVFKQ